MSAAPRAWAELAAWRRARRRDFTAARQALGPDAHRAKSRAIEARLESFGAELTGKIIGIYWPIRHEFDVLPFARRFGDAGGTVALPVVVAPKQPLEFRAWTRDTKMARGVYDIPYPAAGPALVPRVLIVPLLGFDDAGYRLGYGAGYYDRTFAAFAPKPLAIGVGFELGRLPSIEAQPHDIAMDYIVTEAGRWRREGGVLAAE